MAEVEEEGEPEAEFPVARSDSVMVVWDNQLIVWGGYTQTVFGTGDGRFVVALNLPDSDSDDRSLEVCNLETMQWRKQQTHGPSCPIFGKGASSALIGQHLYIFGGLDDEDYRNTLHRLDLEKFAWQELSNMGAPPARSYGGMVAHRECLVVFGGLGKPPLEESRMGAETVRYDKFRGVFISEWNNFIHEYNTVTDRWHELGCTGSRPRPMERFSFDKIDRHRALLFGGKQGLFSPGFQDIHILNLETMHWDNPIGPSSPDQSWPEGRSVHATACLVDPESDLAQQHQQVVVFWGDGNEAIHLSDIWLLHVANRTWTKIDLSLLPRKYHMCVSHFVQERQTDVIVYGGNKRRKSKYDRNVMTNLIVFHFGAVRDLKDICVNFIKLNMSQFEHSIPLLPQRLQDQLSTETPEQYSVYYPSEFIQS